MIIGLLVGCAFPLHRRPTQTHEFNLISRTMRLLRSVNEVHLLYRPSSILYITRLSKNSNETNFENLYAISLAKISHKVGITCGYKEKCTGNRSTGIFRIAYVQTFPCRRCGKSFNERNSEKSRRAQQATNKPRGRKIMAQHFWSVYSWRARTNNVKCEFSRNCARKFN